MDEVERRRAIQQTYNKKHHIIPKAIQKAITPWLLGTKQELVATEWGQVKDVAILEKEMRQAADNLDFERAASLRDLIKNLNNGTKAEYGNNNISKESTTSVRKTKGAKSEKTTLA